MLTAALYGDSLLLSGIGASLEKRAGLRTCSIVATLPDAAERLLELRPGIVIFDLAMSFPEPVIALWRVQPQLLLIGVELASNRALVLSGQSPSVLSADDLIDIIAVFAAERGKT